VTDLTEKLRSVARPTLSASIVGQLRDLVLRGELKPGEQLPGHRDLAQAFRVSVPSVREAISALVTAGVLEAEPGRGTYVSRTLRPDLASPAVLGTPDHHDELDELVEARWGLECLLAVLAAQRATPERVAAMRRSAAVMRDHVTDPERYLEADVELHLQIALAAQNRVLQRAMHAIRALLKRAFRTTLDHDLARGVDVVKASVALHERIIDAIEAHDPAAAEAAMDVLISRTRGTTRPGSGSSPVPAVGVRGRWSRPAHS